jgi:hypothetical protein
MNWDSFDLTGVAEHLRTSSHAAEAERMIWAFEQAVRVARLDAELLPHLLAATTCLLARVEQTSPRTVLETYFRRSISDEVWRERYLPLFG